MAEGQGEVRNIDKWRDVFMEALASEYFEVLVGDNETVWVPETLLCHSLSELGETVEEYRTLLKTVKPRIFKHFNIWLHSWNSARALDGFPLPDIVNLGIFAEKHEVYPLLNQVSDILASTWETKVKREQAPPPAEMIAKVFKNTGNDSVLHGLCAMCLSFIIKDGDGSVSMTPYLEVIHHVPQLTQEVLDFRCKEIMHKDFWKEPCYYHQHHRNLIREVTAVGLCPYPKNANWMELSALEGETTYTVLELLARQ